MLASHFLKKRGVSLDTSALHKLQGYAWPGNVQELENVLERAAIVCGGHVISAEHLPFDMVSQASVAKSLPQVANVDALPAETLSLPEAIEALEIKLIIEALAQTQGNKSRASKLLGISERSLWYKISRYDVAG